jgi:NDP-sugar pyrophosphorylase family protein
MGVKEHILRSPYGEVKLKDENIITISEKPTHKYFANAGIYVLNPECVNWVPNNFFDMTTLFKKIIKKNKKTVSFPLDEYWKDIGTPIDYQEANEEFKKN